MVRICLPSHSPWYRWRIWIVVFCLVVSLLGLAVKLAHATGVARYLGPTETDLEQRGEQLLSYTPADVPYVDYTLAKGYSTANAVADSDISWPIMPVGTGKHFGNVLPLHLNMRERQLVATNIVPFPWNYVCLDLQKIPREQLVVKYRFGRFANLACYVPPGHHVLQYVFSPDKLWTILTIASRIAFVLWILIFAIMCRAQRAKRITDVSS